MNQRCCKECKYADFDADGCTCLIDKRSVYNAFAYSCDQFRPAKPMTKQEVIETLEIFRNDYIREDSAICRAINIAIEVLRHTTIEPEVQHGRWILCKDQYNVDNDNGNYAYYCSCCKHQDVHDESAKVSFCWNCGTRMNTD